MSAKVLRMVRHTYVDDVLDRLGKRLPDCEIDLLRFYALLVLVKGRNTTPKDVHDAWAVWRSINLPEHRSIVPFERLTPEVQYLDDPFVDAILEVAYEKGPVDAR